MNWMRLAYRPIFLALVLSIGITASARAAEGPFFQVSGGPLRKGKTAEITAAAKGNQVLKAGAVTLTCERVALVNGKIEGVEPRNGGKNSEKLEYSGCKVTGNGGNCKPTQPIVTKPLTSTLGYQKAPREGKIYDLLAPSEKGELAVLKFEGPECKENETVLKTKAGASGVIFEVLNTLGAPLEVGKEAEVKSAVLSLPEKAIEKITVEEKGEDHEKTAGLEAFGGQVVKAEGKATVSLPAFEKWGIFTTDIEEETPRYIKAKNELTSEQEGKGTIGSFFLEVPGLTFTILCKGVDNKVGIGAKWNAKLTVEFTECSVVGQTACKVVEPIAIPLLAQLIFKAGKQGEEIREIFYSETAGTFGGLFFEVEVINNGLETCPATIKGKYKVTGSAIGTLSPSKAGEEAAKTNITFKGTEAPAGEYFNLKAGKREKAGTLLVNEKASNLKGEISQELASKEAYGAE